MVLVLPDADDRPVFVGQGLVGFTIPLLAAGKLRSQTATDRVDHGRLTAGEIPADIVYGARKMEVR